MDSRGAQRSIHDKFPNIEKFTQEGACKNYQVSENSEESEEHEKNQKNFILFISPKND